MAKKLVPYSVVNAFTDSAFKGNPTAICLLEEEKDDEWLQAVAREFNLSETCYLTPSMELHIRGFTSDGSPLQLRLSNSHGGLTSTKLHTII